MTLHLPNPTASRERAYSEMTKDILAWLRSGALKHGDRLPTEAELRQQYGISVSSVRKGIDQLVDEGIVERRQGSGTYVVRPGESKARSVRRGRTENTVLLGWEWQYNRYHPYFTELLQGIRNGVESMGWQVDDMLSQKEPGPKADAQTHLIANPDFIAASLRNRQDVMGIIAGCTLVEALPGSLLANVPAVAIGPTSQSPSVYYDWQLEVSRAITAVVECGARSIAVFTDFRQAFIARSLQHVSTLGAELTPVILKPQRLRSIAAHEAFVAARELLAEGTVPDGLVITTDAIAEGVLEGLLSILGSDHRMPIACMVNRASRLQLPCPAMRLIADAFATGRAAASFLDRHIQSPHTTPTTFVPSCSWEYDPNAICPPAYDWSANVYPRTPESIS